MRDSGFSGRWNRLVRVNLVNVTNRREVNWMTPEEHSRLQALRVALERGLVMVNQLLKETGD